MSRPAEIDIFDARIPSDRLTLFMLKETVVVRARMGVQMADVELDVTCLDALIEWATHALAALGGVR